MENVIWEKNSLRKKELDKFFAPCTLFFDDFTKLKR